MKKLLISICIGIFCLYPVFALTESTKIILEFEEETLGLKVPDEILIPKVANGYTSEASFEIFNTGNIDNLIYLDFEGINNSDEYHEIFNVLLFKDFESEEFVFIDRFNMGISKPEILGGERSQSVFMKIDLSESSFFNISQTEEVNLIFTVIAK